MERATPDRAVRVADHGAGETNNQSFFAPTAKKAKSEADDVAAPEEALVSNTPTKNPRRRVPPGKKQLRQESREEAGWRHRRADAARRAQQAGGDVQSVTS